MDTVGAPLGCRLGGDEGSSEGATVGGSVKGVADAWQVVGGAYFAKVHRLSAIEVRVQP